MGTTYTRQSSFSDGDTITAALFNNEYNQLLTAFSYASSGTTGHQHDGTAAEGGNVHTIGDQDFLNKIVADSTNNRWGVFVEVSSSAVEQIRIQDGAIVPVTDNDIDLGTSSLEFKDAYFDGTVTTDGLTVSSTTNLDGAIQVDNTITVGVDDTGYDVKFFGATASAYMLWDASTDDLVLAGAAGIDLAGDIDVDGTANLDVVDIDGAVDMASTLTLAGNADFNGDLDVDGTTNLDAVDIDGAVQIDAAVTVGVDDTGYDVKFFGDTASAYMLWDTSADDLILGGAARVVVPASGLVIGSTAVTSTGAELNILDGVTSTATELNIMDGDTAASSTTLADADRVVVNDAGTMKQVALTDFETYFESAIDTFSTIDINGGSIDGATLGTNSAITQAVIDDIDLNGKVITMTGSASDTAVFTAGTNGTLSIVTTDAAAAAANIQITADGTVDIDSAGVLTLDSGAAINIEPAAGSAILLDGTISVDAGVVTGATSITSTAFVGALTGNVTGNASGTAATVTGAAQSAITSLGTLSTLTVDNVIINGSTIGHTGDTDLITVASGIATVAGEVSMTTLDIGGTNVTSTAAELNILDGVTSTAAELNVLDGITAVVGELNALDIGTTAVGTAVASKAVILDSNKDYTGVRNLTISGEIDAATGDFSGAVDVAGATTTAALTASGILKTDDATEATSTTDGSLQTDGGLSVVKDAVFGDDVKLLSDSAVLSFGADSDVTLTHVADQGLILKNANTTDDKPGTLYLQTGDTDIAVNDYLGRIFFQAPDEAAGTDAIAIAAEISAISEGNFAADNNATSLLFGTGASESATTKMKLSSGGNLSLPTDGVVIAAGVNSDVTLTHVHDTGLLLNSTMALQFNDASQYINAPSATVLDINATDEVEINATLADVNANLDVSGTYTGGGLMTTGGNIVIPDGGTIGSASDTDSIQIRSDGNVAIGGSANDTIAFYVYNNTTGDKVGQFTQAHSSNNTNALQVSQAGVGAGLYAQVELGVNSAVFGYHNSSSSVGIGTRGYSKSGYGVYGQTGASGYAGVIGYSEDASEYAIIGYQNTYGVYATTVTCVGAMSKGSGTFRIPHPLKSEIEGENWDLCHSFIEGPQCDLIYRGRVDLVNGQATISMDTKYGMTAGTFEWLTKDVQTFTSNETGWDAVKSSFSGDTITIECQNTSSTDTISWMVVAERGDPNIIESTITDNDGNLIIERPSDLAPAPPLPEPSPEN